MNLTYRRTTPTIESQEIARFTGEGAYHGSRKRRAGKRAEPEAVVDEMRPTSLEKYAGRSSADIDTFEAVFENLYRVEATLPVPSQEEIRSDGTTLCWCPIDEAIEVSRPVTRRVVEAMKALCVGDKRYTYVDSKLQYFEAGDVPVDSEHWHVDGSIVARGPIVQALGYPLLHDMKARLTSGVQSPRYQSSDHCATLFVTEPVTLTLPELIGNFDSLDAAVRELSPRCEPQPAGTIVRTDGSSLHRAQAASGSGWRLCVRCVETDRKVALNKSIIDCYGTVFRT